MSKYFKFFQKFILSFCLIFSCANICYSDTLSCELIPQKDTYYVGENVELRFELILDENNADIMSNTANLYGLDVIPYISLENMKHGRGAKNSIVFTQKITFIEPGNFVFEPILDYKKIIRVGLLEAFFNGQKTSYETCYGNAIKITIKSLPQATDSFSGIVGDLNVTTTISTNSAELGDVINIMTNVKTENYMINYPKISSIKHVDGFKLYPANIVDITHENQSTSYTIEQKIVANELGDFTISSPIVTYFDVNDKSYKSISNPKQLSIRVSERVIEEVKDVVPTPVSVNESKNTTSTEKKINNYKQYETISISVAKLSPSTAALTIFEIPPYTEITILEEHGGWCRVSYNNNYGWIPISAINMGEK